VTGTQVRPCVEPVPGAAEYADGAHRAERDALPWFVVRVQLVAKEVVDLAREEFWRGA
jgi:hypothetical protein